MGADIHMFLEKRMPSGDWAMMRDFDQGINVKSFRYHPDENTYTHDYRSWIVNSRSYTLFAALAGVRGDGPDPKDLPDDVSEYVALASDNWGSDGHSHSWSTLREFLQAWTASHSHDDEDEIKVHPYAQVALKEGMNEALAEFLWEMCSLDVGRDRKGFNPDDYRFVFWFDN